MIPCGHVGKEHIAECIRSIKTYWFSSLQEEEDEWTLAYEIKFDFRLGGYGAPQVTIVCILDNDSWTVGFLKQLVLIVSTP